MDNKNVRTSFVNPQIDSMAQYYSQKPGGGSVGQGVMGPTNSQYLYQQGTKENTVGGLKSKMRVQSHILKIKLISKLLLINNSSSSNLNSSSGLTRTVSALGMKTL